MIAKYSASGNDFVLFHSFIARDRSDLARRLCDRQNGIGADGLIVLLPHDTCDFRWQFYNSDGSTAEMCGNGSRACAHYAFTQGLAPAKMRFETLAGVIGAEVEGSVVQSDLTPPKLLREDIVSGGKKWWLIDTGVPHLVTFDADMGHFDLDEARSMRFEYNANVNIAAIDAGGGIRVRTYERGVEDETLACGTGMAACFLRANYEGLVGDRAKVFPKSGETLDLGLEAMTITFKGAVTQSFETVFNVE